MYKRTGHELLTVLLILEVMCKRGFCEKLTSIIPAKIFIYIIDKYPLEDIIALIFIMDDLCT